MWNLLGAFFLLSLVWLLVFNFTFHCALRLRLRICAEDSTKQQQSAAFSDIAK